MAPTGFCEVYIKALVVVVVMVLGVGNVFRIKEQVRIQEI